MAISEDNSIKTINPLKWEALLRETVKTEPKTNGPTVYISSVKTTAGLKYEMLTAKELKQENASRLSIAEITSISRSVLDELGKEFKDGTLNQVGFVSRTEEITKHTLALIQARKNKWDNNWNIKKAICGAALVISAVASILIIGIPFFLLLRYVDKRLDFANQKFGEEIKLIKRQLPFREYLERIPAILKGKDFQLSHKKEIRLAHLQKTIHTVLKQRNDDDQFKKDITRGVTFQLKDVSQQIDDKTPFPPADTKFEEKYQTAVDKIHTLTQTNNDHKWEPIIQTVANQSSINQIFDLMIMLINIDAAENPELMWNKLSLKAIHEAELPTIHVEVVRDLKTRNIKALDVQVKSMLDIISYDSYEGDKLQIIAPTAIKGALKYTVILNGEDQPVVSDVDAVVEYDKSLVS